MEPSDLLVIEQIRAGNETAFDALFTAWYGKLQAYAFSVLQNETLAEEAVQNVFCRLWEKRQQWQVHTSMKAFLYISVYHQCMDGLRRVKRVRKYEHHVLQNTAEGLAAPAFGKAELNELEARLQHALSQLPDQCRAIFQLSRYGGMKYREIAEQLGISIKTVEANLCRALKHLRDQLADYL
ncbi:MULTISPECIES: RNA polymerase sigma factor [Niastella]|uniref:RNA polymerase sigma-70 factor n=1 Tax=Niastella soli TaxID=2821487 RepID=A0ABS3Z5L7_9BACT|nr:RNA polymerase sigma-70 factor [Niastella soli]MBO9205441.1 RNA polymerase sigma-70 factor [Niastella soli]